MHNDIHKLFIKVKAYSKLRGCFVSWAATCLQRPHSFGPKVTALDRFHCITCILGVKYMYILYLRTLYACMHTQS